MKRWSFNVTIIAVLSVTFALMANIVAGRLGFFGPFLAPMGVFFFPFIYVLSDVTSDVYGYRVSRWIAWISATVNIVFVFGVLLVISAVRPAPFSVDADNALRLILVGNNSASGMIRVMFAGLVGQVLGGWANDVIFQIFRHKDGTAHFAKRKLLSSAAAEAIDTATFITLAFAGTAGWSIQIYFVQFCLKYLVEVITEPLAAYIARKIRAREGEEVFEDRNKFNLFGFERRSPST